MGLHDGRINFGKWRTSEGVDPLNESNRQKAKRTSAPWSLIFAVLPGLCRLYGCCDDHGSGSSCPSTPESPGRWGGEECRAESYDRYGDYLSTQMVTNLTFGYGMFVSEFQAADGPTCSTFRLYADEPSVRNLPDVAQNWRWNEIEFVPYTEATQSQGASCANGSPREQARSGTRKARST